MKTKEELREWLWNRFNSCYRIESSIKGNYNLYYNKGYVRKKKIQYLLGEDVEEPKEVLSDSICLFELDYKNGDLYCSYDEIWAFFEKNSSYNYQGIRDLIKGLLEEHTKLGSLTPKENHGLYLITLEEHTKLGSLTPVRVKSWMVVDWKRTLNWGH